MDLFEIISEVLDLRSFSSLWYWIVLAVMWTTLSNSVINVPFRLAVQAGKSDGQALQDFEDLTRINVNRIANMSPASGLFNVALTSASLSALFVLGFQFNVEFAQAVFCLLLQLTLIALINIKYAHRVFTYELHGAELIASMRQHRFYIQIIGVCAIFMTAMWGMFQNLGLSLSGY